MKFLSSLRFLASMRSGKSLEPWEILKRFARDVIVTALIYLLLVAVTAVLHRAAELDRDSPMQYAVIRVLENVIFLCGSLTAFFIIILVTVVTGLELWQSFRLTFLTGPTPAPPTTAPPDATPTA